MSADDLRLAALVVVGGPLKDRRYELEEVVAEVLIGSDPDCHLHVDLPGISPIHARLWADLNSVTAYDTHAPRGIYVNDEQVTGQAQVHAGDWLWLGPPTEPDSVCIQCRFEPWVEVLPEAAPAAADAPPEGEASPPAPQSGGSPPPLEAYEPGVLVEETPEVGGEPTPVPVPGTADPNRPTAEPGLETLLSPAPEATPPPAESGAGTPEPAPGADPFPAAPSTAEDPFFVGAEPPAATATPGPSAPAAPPDAAGEDAWSIAEPLPPAGPPAASPEAPAADHFFIAEELLTAPASSSSPPTGRPPEPTPLLPPEPGPTPSLEEPLIAEEILPPSEPAPVVAPASAPPRPEAAASPETPSFDTALVATEVPAPEVPAAPPSALPARSAEPAASEPSVPAPAPAAPRRPRPPSAARRGPAAGARRPARPARGRSGAPEWLRPVGLGAGAALVLGVIGIALVTWLGASVTVEDISPARVRVGQRAVLTGTGFSEDPARNTVLFGGVTATIVSASKTRLEVEVPEAVAEAGAERRVPVVVRRGSLESEPLELSVFQGPVLHGLSPDVALPGEEVVLAGAGWGIGATVRFGDVGAEILESDPSQIRVTVPPLPGGYGTAAPVVVTVGGVESKPAPFFVGRVPLVTGLPPGPVSVGDVLTVSGRGFERDPGENDVRVDGVQALVVSSSREALTVVVPRLETGEPARSLEVRVAGLPDVGRGVVEVAAPPDPVGLRFVAEPFDGPSAHPHAVLSTDLGPVFVLAAADGRSAAERALAAQQAFNAAVPVLAASADLLPEARDVEMRPVLAVPGQLQPLLEVTEADAAAYNEDWTRLRSRAREVTPARLARWWEAVARDLVLVLVRAEPPRFAAALAPEGRVFQQVFDAAQRSGGPVSAAVVAGLRSGTRDELRVVALRVPPSVNAEVAAAAGTVAGSDSAPTPAPAPRREPLQLDGSWSGTESEQGRQRYVTVTFRRDYGSIAYEGGLTLTVPFLKLERPGRDRVRFTVQIRGGIRHYLGSWDGETLGGNIARDEAGRDVVGTFELRRR